MGLARREAGRDDDTALPRLLGRMPSAPKVDEENSIHLFLLSVGSVQLFPIVGVWGQQRNSVQLVESDVSTLQLLEREKEEERLEFRRKGNPRVPSKRGVVHSEAETLPGQQQRRGLFQILSYGG